MNRSPSLRALALLTARVPLSIMETAERGMPSFARQLRGGHPGVFEKGAEAFGRRVAARAQRDVVADMLE